METAPAIDLFPPAIYVRTLPRPLNFALEPESGQRLRSQPGRHNHAHKIQFNGFGGLRTHISFTANAGDNTNAARPSSKHRGTESLSARKQENERSFAVGQRNVGDSVRRRDVGGWAVVYRK